MDLLFIDELQGTNTEATATNEAVASGITTATNGTANNQATGNLTTEYTEVPGDEPETDAEAEPAAAGSPWTFWIMIGAMILIMYFFMWRPERKRRKQMEQFRNELKKGDKIITAGGIYGTIKEVRDNSLLIEVGEGCDMTMRVDKSMVVGDPSQAQQR